MKHRWKIAFLTFSTILSVLLLIGGVLTIWYSLSPDGNSVAESARTDLETLP